MRGSANEKARVKEVVHLTHIPNLEKYIPTHCQTRQKKLAQMADQNQEEFVLPVKRTWIDVQKKVGRLCELY
jgi:hypothetical protein